jgi:hypothetical protein
VIPAGFGVVLIAQPAACAAAFRYRVLAGLLSLIVPG